jgi:hypothetical protein
MARRRMISAVGRGRPARLVTPAGLGALLLLAVTAAYPPPAHAFDVKGALKDALEWLFLAEPIEGATDQTLKFLVQVPNYIERPGSIEALGQTTTAIAGASLAAVATLAVVHYWAAGVSLSGGGDPVEAVPRTVGAGLFILAWPWIFEQSVALTNQVTSILISESQLGEVARTMFQVGKISGFGILIALLLGLAGTVVMILVVFVKIGLVATLALLCVGVPLAVGLYPLPSLSWIAQFALKLFAAILMIFVTWALELATIGALGNDFLTWSGGGSWVAQVTKPLVGLALLILMMSTAKHWLRVAGVLSGGGGIVRHTLGWAAAHLAFNAAAQHIPDALGGRATALKQQAAVAQDAAGLRQETRQRYAAADARRAAAEASASEKAASRKEAQTAQAWRQHEADRAAQVHRETEQAWSTRAAGARQAAERDARTARAEAAGLAEYDRWAAQDDRSHREASGARSPASTRPALADSNTIGNADSPYDVLRPELQARVGALVHGDHTDDQVRAGLRELRSGDVTPMERHALGELGKLDSGTLGATIPATPRPGEQPRPTEPPQQARPDPPNRTEPTGQPRTAQPPPPQPPPAPTEPPAQR